VAGQYLLLRHEIIPTDDPAVSDLTNTSFASQSETWSNWIRYYNDVILILGTANYTAGPSSFLLQYPTVSQLIGNPYRTILNNAGLSDTRNLDIEPFISTDGWGLEVTYADSDNGTPEISYLPGGRIQDPLFIFPCWLDHNCSATDFWGFIGRLFEGLHWLYLGDFGQISATEYPGYGQESINWSNSTSFPPTNNIFVNSSLYQIVRDTRSNLYQPNFQPGFYGIPEFNETDVYPLHANKSTVLVQSYYCQQRQLKRPLNLLLTVLGADYALIVGGYTLVVLIASLIEKGRKEGIVLSGPILYVANYCEGCFQPVPSEEPAEEETEIPDDAEPQDGQENGISGEHREVEENTV